MWGYHVNKSGREQKREDETQKDTKESQFVAVYMRGVEEIPEPTHGVAHVY